MPPAVLSRLRSFRRAPRTWRAPGLLAAVVAAGPRAPPPPRLQPSSSCRNPAPRRWRLRRRACAWNARAVRRRRQRGGDGSGEVLGCPGAPWPCATPSRWRSFLDVPAELRPERGSPLPRTRRPGEPGDGEEEPGRPALPPALSLPPGLLPTEGGQRMRRASPSTSPSATAAPGRVLGQQCGGQLPAARSGARPARSEPMRLR